MDFSRYWTARQKEVDAALNRLLPSATTKPKTIHQAMRYSIFAGGKRLRPVLTLAAAALWVAGANRCLYAFAPIGRSTR